MPATMPATMKIRFFSLRVSEWHRGALVAVQRRMKIINTPG
jgi:hypothetical protein